MFVCLFIYLFVFKKTGLLENSFFKGVMSRCGKVLEINEIFKLHMTNFIKNMIFSYFELLKYFIAYRNSEYKSILKISLSRKSQTTGKIRHIH